MKNKVNYIYALFSLVPVAYLAGMKYWQAKSDYEDFNNHLTIYITLFAGFTFLSIRSFLVRNQNRNGNVSYIHQIQGLNWLIATMWLWAVASLFAIYWPYTSGLTPKIVDTILSGLNSVTILLAIQYFEPEMFAGLFSNNKILKKIGRENYEKWIWAIYLVFISASCFLKVYPPTQTSIFSETLILIPDISLAIFLTAFILWKIFRKRNLPEVAWMTVFSFALVLTSQILLVLFRFNQSGVLLNIINGDELTKWVSFTLIAYKTLLIMIFLAESFLWLWKEKNRMLENQRSQMSHIVRGTIRNISTEMQNRKENSNNPEIVENFELIINRLNYTVELHDYINQNEAEKYTNLHRFFTRSMERFSKAEGIEGYFSLTTNLENYGEILTENAEMIVFAALELCSNAARSVKRAGRKQPKIAITAFNTAGSLEITVEDNGEGGYDSKTFPGDKSGYGTKYLNQVIKEHFEGEWMVKPKMNEPGSMANIKISNSKIFDYERTSA